MCKPFSVLLVSLALTAVFVSPARAAGDRWALLIGVDKCEAVGELEVCAADALALKSVLEQIGYPASHITVLVDNQSNVNSLPTIGNVERAIKRLAQVAEADDKILFFFSGHGVTYNGTSFLVPTDGDLTKGVSLAWIKDQFAACKAKEKVMILDACHSGAAKGVSGITPDLKTSGNLVMLLSCEKEQVSWPDKEGRHSVFTSAVLDGLTGKAANADQKVTHRTLAEYVRKSVKGWTYTNQKNEQTPVLVADASGEIILADIALIKPPSVTVNVIDRPSRAQKAETVEELLAARKFAEAVSKIDARTDLAWRTCVEHLDRLQTTINNVESKGANVETDCALLRTRIRDVAGDFCLWYEQAPREWQLACKNACGQMRDTLSALLEKLPEGEPATYVHLVNDLRTFSAVLAPQEECVLPEKVKTRYALLAMSLRKQQAALVPVPNGIWIDDISRRPLAVQVQVETKELDGMILMYVPEGPVTIGSFGAADSRRVQVGLTGFYIAKWEVTARQFRAFCDEMNRDYPADAAKPDGPAGDALQPVSAVRHREAVEFCDWLGRKLAAKGWKGECRLPSECEMEKAARGISIYQYSWGYRFDESGCVNAITSPGRSQPAESAGADLSFQGVANLAGNVSEWCCDDWVPSLVGILSPKTRDMIARQEDTDGVRFKVVKGGNYTCREASRLEVSARGQESPGSAAKHIGFRVVLRPRD